MRNIEIKVEKQIYSRPEIICIELDNDISLAMESTPPFGPDEGYSKVQHRFYNNPFKNSLS
jgi:hypothetical protein